jgi:hypothetical protein
MHYAYNTCTLPFIMTRRRNKKWIETWLNHKLHYVPHVRTTWTQRSFSIFPPAPCFSTATKPNKALLRHLREGKDRGSFGANWPWIDGTYYKSSGITTPRVCTEVRRLRDWKVLKQSPAFQPKENGQYLEQNWGVTSKYWQYMLGTCGSAISGLCKSKINIL